MTINLIKSNPNTYEPSQLRNQIIYWHQQYDEALKSEALLKTQLKELQQTLMHRDAKISQLQQQIEALKAKIILLQQQVFGRKTEQTKNEPSEQQTNESDITDYSDEPGKTKRNRGQQKGAKGHGRKIRHNLPSVEQIHELPVQESKCPICGRPFAIFPGTEDSEEIEWQVILRRRIHKRVRYIPTCNCHAVPGIVTTPPPPKLIPRGMFATSFWVRLILEKFLFQHSLCRVRKALALEGLFVSQGTLTGGLKKINKLIQPVYELIIQRCRIANHWKMDETRWLVFVEYEGKSGYRWWLWVIITKDTVVYILDPTRSSNVPKNLLPDNPQGIINADRFSAYKALSDGIRIAYCWVHVRRDFDRIYKSYTSLRPWAQAWLNRINELFKQNKKRVNAISSPELFAGLDKTLRSMVDNIAKIRDTQLANPTLHKAARKALQSLFKHWSGCTIFVDNPLIPMDNNESERFLRTPVLGRNNYYGSGSIWSGNLTAMLFSVIQTLLKNNIDPQKWLLSYFNACAQNQGNVPKNIKDFLPWNLSSDQKQDWLYPNNKPQPP